MDDGQSVIVAVIGEDDEFDPHALVVHPVVSRRIRPRAGLRKPTGRRCGQPSVLLAITDVGRTYRAIAPDPRRARSHVRRPVRRRGGVCPADAARTA